MRTAIPRNSLLLNYHFV